MNLVGVWFIQPDELGVKKLKEFIEASLQGPNVDQHELVTNKIFSFTLYREDLHVPEAKRRDVQNASEKREVKLPEKTVLHFYPAARQKHVRDKSRVIFNEGDGSLTLYFQSGNVAHNSSPLKVDAVRHLPSANFSGPTLFR